MTTLVLLHGAWHGAWCWEPFLDVLRSSGVDGLAIDLPADEPGADAERCADVVADLVGDRDDLVVVPHSLAGLYAPLVARRLGAKGVVNLAALTPEPGSSGLGQAKRLASIYTQEYRAAPVVRHDDGSTSLTPEIARELLYADVDEATATWAIDRLRRQYWLTWTQPCAITSFDGLAYAHIACTGDRVLDAPGMEDGAARTSAPLTWIPGGHMPMVSHPGEAVDAVLAAIAAW